jgi:hypothetical protein
LNHRSATAVEPFAQRIEGTMAVIAGIDVVPVILK